MTVVAHKPRLDQWSERAEWPLAAAALTFFGCYAWLVLDPGLPRHVHRTLEFINYTVWALFAVDYVVRVSLAHGRGMYVLRHLPDLLILALPVLRPLRLLRLVVLLKVLNRRAADSLRGRVAIYVLFGAGIVVFCASLAELDAERGHPGANINDFADALWWASVTVCTVGYGDRYPTTTEGRFVAIALMLGGIALLGVVTASIAAWLLAAVRDVEESSGAATRADIERLRGEVADLRQLIIDGAAAQPTPSAPA